MAYAQTNITFTKTIGGSSRAVTIYTTDITEDYGNDLFFVEPGKGQSSQGATGEFSSAKTKILDRLRVRHSIEITGHLKYNDTDTAEFQANLLRQMVLHGSLGTRPISVSGFQRINASGTLQTFSMDGIITKLSTSKKPQDLSDDNDEIIEVKLQFVEGGAGENNRFLRNRDMRS
jgi:hypothetical protein